MECVTNAFLKILIERIDEKIKSKQMNRWIVVGVNRWIDEYF